MQALAFLDTVAKAKRLPIYVLNGDEDFLKRRCREAIIRLALGVADADFAVSAYTGENLDYSAVRNELETVAFLAPIRIVCIDQADSFVSAHRDSLERYAANPSRIGVLILDLKTFPETTKLAKALPDAAKLLCKAPPENQVSGWCVRWAKAGHGKKLSTDAAELLVDLIGTGMGVLDQALAKLAVSAGANVEISAEDVDRLVGRSNAANVFVILDAIGYGKPAQALAILRQQFEMGQEPMKTLGAITKQLRTLATVERALAQGLPTGTAMDTAGVPNWPQKRQEVERQIRYLGKVRLRQINDWLVEINLGMKGGNPLPPQMQLERLIVRLARPPG
jgi:DNA polymerase III subunit delta